MADLIATPSDPKANSYLTIAEADELFDAFDQGDKWDDLDEDAKARLLLQGARKVDQYKAWGPPKVDGQRLAFPRQWDVENTIPDGVKTAVMEYANFKLEGSMEPLKKLQEEGATSASILGQSTTFKEDASGLPAGSRRELDKLWNSTWPVGRVGRNYNGSDDRESIFG